LRAVVQRVLKASVVVNGAEVARIGRGLLVFLGVGTDDDESDGRYIADKVANLRIFEDSQGKMNHSVLNISGEVLVVSQFTLYGDCRKGRRPSFSSAAPLDKAKSLYDFVVQSLKNYDLTVREGIFRESMQVYIVNDGPVTMLLDSKKLF